MHIGSVGSSGNGRGVAVVGGVPTFIQWAPHVELHVFAEACYKCGPAAVPDGPAAPAAAAAAAAALAAGVTPGGPTRLQARLAEAADGHGAGGPPPQLIAAGGLDDRILAGTLPLARPQQRFVLRKKFCHNSKKCCCCSNNGMLARLEQFFGRSCSGGGRGDGGVWRRRCGG